MRRRTAMRSSVSRLQLCKTLLHCHRVATFVAATHVCPELTNAHPPAATSRSHLSLIHTCHWGSLWPWDSLILRNECSANLRICRYWQLSCFGHLRHLGLRLCRVCFRPSICALPTTLSLALRFRRRLCFSTLLSRLLELIVTYDFGSPQYQWLGRSPNLGFVVSLE
jgi:hypothetical protein